MPKLVDADAQRGQILAAARAVFAERGLKGTGLAHVAEAAGMGRSSLYHYYPEKDSLIRDLLRELLAEEESLFRGALAGDGSPRQRIERFLRRQLAFFDAWCSLAPLIFDLRSSHTRLLRPFFRRIRATLAHLIAEGQAAGELGRAIEPEIAASVAIGAIDGLLLQHYVDRKVFADRDALADALLRSLLGGLAS